MLVQVVFLVSNCAGSLHDRLQLVLDFFKRSVMILTWAMVRDVSTKRTRIGPSLAWIRFHL
jgi:hypothetical protein